MYPEITEEKELVVRTLKGPQFNRGHGSLYDRGSADSYYGRPQEPHFYPQGTGNGPRVTDLNESEIAEYMAGYEWNEQYGDKKNWF